MLRRTVLFDTHLSAHAHMAHFAGWEMPAHYGSLVEETRRVRQSVGIVDVSHMTIVDLEGPDTLAFLNGLLTQDTHAIRQPGGVIYSALLNPMGEALDQVTVYCLSKNRYRMVSNALTREIVCAWLLLHMEQRRITLTLRDENAMLALHGPQALGCLSQCLSSSQAAVLHTLKPMKTLAAQALFIARTGHTNGVGFDIMLPATQAVDFWHRAVGAGAVPCGLTTFSHLTNIIEEEQCI